MDQKKNHRIRHDDSISAMISPAPPNDVSLMSSRTSTTTTLGSAATNPTALRSAPHSGHAATSRPQTGCPHITYGCHGRRRLRANVVHAASVSKGDGQYPDQRNGSVDYRRINPEAIAARQITTDTRGRRRRVPRLPHPCAGDGRPNIRYQFPHSPRKTCRQLSNLCATLFVFLMQNIDVLDEDRHPGTALALGQRGEENAYIISRDAGKDRQVIRVPLRPGPWCSDRCLRVCF